MNNNPEVQIVRVHVDIIEKFDRTRKPTQKRVYRERFDYKIKFINSDFHVCDMIYDVTNELDFYVTSITNDGYVIAISILPTLKNVLDNMCIIVKSGSFYTEFPKL